jgi:prepilin-type N-terminal cleavage/methylation domain-containing protein
MRLAPGYSSSAKRRAGFTLPEVVIASAIMLIIVTVVISMSMFGGRSFAAMTNYIDLDTKSRTALDSMVREVRQAKGLYYFTNNMIKLTNASNQQVTYAWNKGNGTFTRSANGVPDRKPMLTECQQLSFKIYQRTPSINQDFYDTATNVAQAKLLNVSWLCSRSILGKVVNTESVQTTKIVMRNQKVTN